MIISHQFYDIVPRTNVFNKHGDAVEAPAYFASAPLIVKTVGDCDGVRIDLNHGLKIVINLEGSAQDVYGALREELLGFSRDRKQRSR